MCRPATKPSGSNNGSRRNRNQHLGAGQIGAGQVGAGHVDRHWAGIYLDRRIVQYPFAQGTAQGTASARTAIEAEVTEAEVTETEVAIAGRPQTRSPAV